MLHRHAAFACPLLVLLGCGHPATEGECEALFNRSAELELEAQNIRDPERIRQRVADARKARGERLVKECVGKRITDDALGCVKSAATVEQLDKCLK